MTKPVPVDIKLHQKSHFLEVIFDDGKTFNMSCEYLRVFSPSAEVQGHGPGQETLQLDKEGVNIIAIEPIGNYGVKLFFDDGHNTGIYSWDVLHRLGTQQENNWKTYLQRLSEAGHSHSALQS